MTVELKDQSRFPIREPAEDDLLMVFGGSEGPGAVPAAGLGGGAAGMMIMFPGPLVSRSAPAWRTVTAIQLNTIAAWLDEASTANCTLSIEDADGSIMASITIPAGSKVATQRLPAPLNATLSTPLIARLSIPSGQTGRNALLVVTKG